MGPKARGKVQMERRGIQPGPIEPVAYGTRWPSMAPRCACSSAWRSLVSPADPADRHEDMLVAVLDRACCRRVSVEILPMWCP